MIVLASEDIGNADPQALPIAVAAAHAVEHVGFPEAEFALAQAAIYLSLAPKSDAVKRAMGEVHGYIREHGDQAAAGRAALGRLPGGAQARARQGLRLPARAPGPRQRPGAPARGARGAALLLPRRGRAGGARAAGGDPQGARPRLTLRRPVTCVTQARHAGADGVVRERWPRPSPAPTALPGGPPVRLRLARRSDAPARARAAGRPRDRAPPRSRWRGCSRSTPGRAR